VVDRGRKGSEVTFQSCFSAVLRSGSFYYMIVLDILEAELLF
jgi:hypothetical protein